MSEQNETVRLTETQQKSRRQRSIAIGLCLIAFVLIIYVGTWAKMGAAILQRPM